MKNTVAIDDKFLFDMYDEFEGTEDKKQAEYIYNAIISDENFANAKTIHINGWGAEMFDNTPEAIINLMIANKEKFQNIEEISFGNCSFEVNELSWTNHSDYTKLIKALPKLKTILLAGNTPDMFSGKLESQSLEDITIKTGGLDKSIINTLCEANLPNLKSLTLYEGVDNYGLNCSFKDYKDLITSDVFKGITKFGIVNSERQDEIVKFVLDNNIHKQLTEWNISMGTLTDEGGQLLLDKKDELTNLNRIKIEFCFLSPEMAEKLKNSGLKVEISDLQDDDWKYPMYTE